MGMKALPFQLNIWEITLCDQGNFPIYATRTDQRNFTNLIQTQIKRVSLDLDRNDVGAVLINKVDLSLSPAGSLPIKEPGVLPGAGQAAKILADELLGNASFASPDHGVQITEIQPRQPHLHGEVSAACCGRSSLFKK